jgi:hypothetical protein
MQPHITTQTEYRPVSHVKTTPMMMMQDVTVSRPALVFDDNVLQAPHFKLEKVVIEKDVVQQVRGLVGA